MREKKDILEQIIVEDLEEEAAKIRETIADMDPETLSPEKKAEIKDKVYERISDYDVARVMEQLSEKYQKAMKKGLSAGDAGETGTTSGIDGGHAEAKKKKNAGRKKRIRAYVATAAVLVLVTTFGVNSFGGRENVMRAMRKIVGRREVSQVDSDKGNLVIEGEKEEEAYQEVKKAFDISPVRIIERPEGMEFVSWNVETDAQIAKLFYKYNNKNLLYMINMAYSKDSFGMDIEDEAADEYILEVRGVKIHMKEYQVADAESKKYSADFEYKKAKYFLIGTMGKDDFELIVKNFYFSA